MSSTDKLFLSIALLIIGVLLCYVDLLKFYHEKFGSDAGGGFGNYFLLNLVVGLVLALCTAIGTLPLFIYPHVLYYKSTSTTLLVLFSSSTLGVAYALYSFYKVRRNSSDVFEFEQFKIWLSLITVATITLYRFQKKWESKENVDL